MIFLVYGDGPDGRDAGLLRFEGTDIKMALFEFAKYFGLIEEFDKTLKNKDLLDLFRKHKGYETFWAIITAKGTVINLNDDFLGVEDVN